MFWYSFLSKRCKYSCRCGVTTSPLIAFICIQGNWKIPGVMNSYIRYENADDEYVGRSGSGHSSLKMSLQKAVYTLISATVKRVRREHISLI